MAINAILDALKPGDNAHMGHDHLGRKETLSESGGRALIYVWALEQRGSRRGWDEGCEQDVMVPWVTKGNPINIHGTGTGSQKKNSLQRQGKKYRAVGRQAEGEDSRSNMGETILEAAPSNCPEQLPPPVKADWGPESHEGASPDSEGEGAQATKTFQRYYHLYRSGELERDIAEAGGRVVESGYEKDNWWAIVTRG
jgi:tRNA (uracil-5-)-methyltransferase TRM9